MGGDAVRGVSVQVKNRFLRGLASKPTTVPWTADNTLFGGHAAPFLEDFAIDNIRISVFWVGINDCA